MNHAYCTNTKQGYHTEEEMLHWILLFKSSFIKVKIFKDASQWHLSNLLLETCCYEKCISREHWHNWLVNKAGFCKNVLLSSFDHRNETSNVGFKWLTDMARHVLKHFKLLGEEKVTESGIDFLHSCEPGLISWHQTDGEACTLMICSCTPSSVCGPWKQLQMVSTSRSMSLFPGVLLSGALPVMWPYAISFYRGQGVQGSESLCNPLNHMVSLCGVKPTTESTYSMWFSFGKVG